MTVTVLRRPVYGMSQVDHLLGVRSGTARRWIDGYARGDRRYPPVIRPEHTGDESVTWGEFVEARFLANYRDKGVSLARLRPVVERLRRELDTPYPLAMARLWVDDRDLVAEVQEAEGLETALRLVYVVRTGQTKLAPAAEDFVDRVDWQDGTAARILPLGKDSPVVLDPERNFGSASVSNVRTDVLAEDFRAGDAPPAIARGYGLELGEVEAALRYEMQLRVAS